MSYDASWLSAWTSDVNLLLNAYGAFLAQTETLRQMLKRYPNSLVVRGDDIKNLHEFLKIFNEEKTTQRVAQLETSLQRYEQRHNALMRQEEAEWQRKLEDHKLWGPAAADIEFE
jgi:hypothetical protein